MSKSPTDYDVGYKRTPQHTRFANGNQAARGRRRRKAGKSRLVDGIQDALLQDVPVQRNGKRERVPLQYAMGQQLVQQMAKAPFQPAIKAWAELKKHGFLDSLEDEARLAEERAELDKERQDFRRSEHDFRELHRVIREQAEQDQFNLRCAYQMLTTLKEQDDRGAFEGEFLRRYEQLGGLVISPEEAEQLTEKFERSRRLAAQEDADDYPADSDLSAGCLVLSDLIAAAEA